MRRALVSLYALILCSAVLCAADLGHSAVAALTRSGFIAGPYLTYAHVTVVPALLAGLIVGVIAAIAFLGDALASAAGCAPSDLLVHAASRVARVRFIPLATVILGSQLLLLIGMESAEQIAAFGHSLGFAAALGAPVFIALAVHALAALVMAGAALFLSRSIAAAGLAVARALGPRIRRLLVSASSAQITRRQIVERGEGQHLKPLAHHIANRPPPLTFSAA